MENTLLTSDLKAFVIDDGNIENRKSYYLMLQSIDTHINKLLAIKTSMAKSTIKFHFEKALKVVFNTEEKLDQNFEIRNERIISSLNQIKHNNIDYNITIKYYIFLLSRASYRVRSSLVSCLYLFQNLFIC